MSTQSSRSSYAQIPLNAYDNAVAIDQMEVAYSTLLARPVAKAAGTGGFDATSTFALDGQAHPRIVTLGGDHTIVLPLLRSISSAYGPISVIHFDSHLDTWKPSVFGGAPSDQAAINHGTYFYWGSQEGLIKNGSSIVCISPSAFRPVNDVSMRLLARRNSHDSFRSRRL